MNQIKRFTSYVKSNWQEPQKKGNEVSIKGLVGINIAAMGIEGASGIFSLLSFTATSTVLGLIFGLSLQATYIITSIGTVLNLLFVPMISNITDNIGMVDKKTFKKINLGGLGTAIICAILWVTPSSYFDFLLADMYKHIAIILGIKYLSIYSYLLIYKICGQKYGKYKPWILLMGIPAVVFSTVMVFIPYQELRPSQLLIITNIVSTATTVFSVPYIESYKKMANLMTHNSTERTTIFSILPILSGLLSSLTSTLLPIFATLMGYEINSIGFYQIMIPVFAIFSVLTSLFILWSEEKIKTAPKSVEERLGFKETIQTVFANKYLWITRVAAAFSALSTFDLILFNWMLLYSLREQFWMGILTTLVSIPATPANLITPYLTKKFDNKKLILFLKLAQIFLVCAHIPFIYFDNKVMILILMTLLGMVTTLVRKPKNILEKTAEAQALDYHEWKYGRRVDESTSYFQYITVPFMLLLGYCSPYLMGLAGFVSDRDILYDSTVSSSVFVIIVILYVLELLGNTIPYFFFDLDSDKLKIIKHDLEQRQIEEEKQVVNS